MKIYWSILKDDVFNQCGKLNRGSLCMQYDKKTFEVISLVSYNIIKV